MKPARLALTALALVLLVCLLAVEQASTRTANPPPQPAERVLDEMRAVYLANLERWNNGQVPPLRWNRQLTEAARWFAWDSTIRDYCGHTDSLGRSPWDRALAFGYLGFAGAENAVCGYLPPEEAVSGWMSSTTGHRENLLNPYYRETGLGYYLREGDGEGYVTQDFGHDSAYSPVVIQYEAITTTSTTVSLYVYDQSTGGGFAGMGPATEMLLSNDSTFAGATWQSYDDTPSWDLESGTGWRSVYVKTRDAVGRTAVVSDAIYLGATVPISDLGLHLASTTSEIVQLYGIDTTGMTHFQLSQNWFVDNTNNNFELISGSGAHVSDPAALGSTAFRLGSSSLAWVWTTEFHKDIPLVAYFRLKVSNNSSSSDVVRIRVKGGGVEYPGGGWLTLNGTDFDTANVYQEFAIDFAFHSGSDPWLIFYFERTGSTNVYVDGVYIFTPPQTVQSQYDWQVPGGNYRCRGVWLRYSNSSHSTFSEVEEANRGIGSSPPALSLMAEYGGPSPASRTVQVVQTRCETSSWTVSDDVGWMNAQAVGGDVQVTFNTSGLPTDTYSGAITVTADVGVLGSPLVIPVTLYVVDDLSEMYLPLTPRNYAH